MFLNILIISYFLIINDFTSARWARESYDIPKLPSEISSSPPPAKLAINLTGSEINLSISDQREYFKLVLFANPFIKERPINGCPPLNTSDYDMRMYWEYCKLSVDEKVNNVTFSRIFTGCHYFVMINKENQRWDFGDFYETSYKYINTRVTLKNDWITRPERQDSSLQLKLIFEIPLDCISVAVDLFETPKTVRNAEEGIKNQEIQEVQSCIIRIKDANVSVNCALIGNISAAVKTGGEKNGDAWIVHLTWANLTRGGGHYYLHYSNTDLECCKNQYRTENIITWELMKVLNAVDLDEHHESGTPVISPRPKRSPWLLIGCGSVGFIFIIMLFCLIWMWHRLSGPFCKKNENDETPALPRKPMRLVVGNKQANILLIYERGCPSDEKLETFKRSLKQECRGYKIRDVYAQSEWTNLEKLNGVQKWVEQQLKAGSIVIWFDTPKLRSRLNDQEKYQTSNDFRDQAVPHAVALAKSLFQDTNTQYRRHFVVRLKGFEVDDQQDDPLEMVSPYARYLLPDQFCDLCNHLNSSMESLKYNEELELDSQSNSESGIGVSQINIRALA